MSAINALRDPTATAQPNARVLPLRRGIRVDVLPADDLERIRTAAIAVLADIGIGVGSATLREGLTAAGAETDDDTGRVRFPTALTDEALGRVPRTLLLAARDPACDLRVGEREAWLSPGGGARMAVDLTTDARRPSTEADLTAATRLADAVPQLGYVGSSVAALDAPDGSRALHELHAQLANTSKHVQLKLTAEVPDGDALVEIARVAAGGETELRERPIVSASLRLRTPLALDGLEVAVALAEAGVPCGFVAHPVAGVSAPATPAGALASTLAETLAGVVALELLVPGAPTFVGTSALTAALGEEPLPGGPQDPLFQMAWVQLTGRFGVPAQLGALATGSKSSDWQAGLESGLSATACWMAPADLLPAAGLRNGGRLFSPIAMLLDAELFDLVRQVPLGFAADEEAIALEVIENVGPGGHFLGEPHTLRHMREAWMSRYMDKDSWEAWEEAGRPEPPERAAERARELLSSHEPTPLESAAEERIREVIAEHERDHG